MSGFQVQQGGTNRNMQALFASACITSTIVPLTKAKDMIESKVSMERTTQRMNIGDLNKLEAISATILQRNPLVLSYCFQV